MSTITVWSTKGGYSYCVGHQGEPLLSSVALLVSGALLMKSLCRGGEKVVRVVKKNKKSKMSVQQILQRRVVARRSLYDGLSQMEKNRENEGFQSDKRSTVNHWK